MPTDTHTRITCDGCGERFSVKHQESAEVLFCPFCNQTLLNIYDDIDYEEDIFND